MKLTREPKRTAIYTLYAWMRAADDAVDDAASPAHARVALAAFQQQTEDALAGREVQGPIWPAATDMFERYALDPAILREALQGQADDLTLTQIATQRELETYCYRVASTVGLCCVRIWGHDQNPSVDQLATYRGYALQLTNILRDLREDALRGRCYLPEEDLQRFGISREQLAEAEVSDRFDRLMRFQIERARSYYEMSATLESHLHPDGRASCAAMRRVYHALLERIAFAPRRVLIERTRVSKWQKLTIATRARLGV